MERKMGKEPWKCQTCRRLNKASTGFCGQCGYPWEQCWDRTYVHSTTKNYIEDATWQHWDAGWAASSWDQRPKSPRTRSKSPRSSWKGDGNHGKSGSKGGKGTSTSSQKGNQRWPTPVLDYSKIRDGKKPEVVPPRQVSTKPSNEPSPEVQELLSALQTSYPDGLPQEVQSKVDRLKRSTTMDLKKHIGQMTKVKKDLDSMRAARVRHKEAWTRHVQNLVENTKAQLQQFQSVLANFDACEVELVQSFDAARRAILDITQQTTPAEEDAKAIAELDSALLAGGPGAPIEVEDENDQKEESTDINMNEVTQLQSTLAACVSSLTESHTASDRPRSRSPRGGGTVKDF